MSNYIFADEHADYESHLDYFGARFYDPASAHFLSIDPELIAASEGITLDQAEVIPGSIDSYAYVMNNPLTRIDPTGRWMECFTGPDGMETCTKHAPAVGLAILVLPMDGWFMVAPVYGGDQRDADAAMMGNQLGVGLGALGGLTASAAVALSWPAVIAAAMNPRIYAQLEKQLSKDGAQSIRKALESATRTLAEHRQKLAELERSGGFTSAVEKTIRNVEAQIRTIEKFIADKGL